MRVELLAENREWLVCVKPAGLLSERGGLPELLEAQCGGEIWCVHRLDRAVGGVMIYARSRRAAARLSEAIAAHRMEKTYFAVLEGNVEPAEAELRDLLYHDAARNKSFVVQRPRAGVKEARLCYERLETSQTQGKTLSLVKIRLYTGRSHQIRVQFASRQTPLAGDRRYGGRLALPGPALWACELSFPDPENGAERRYYTPPPAVEPWTGFSFFRMNQSEGEEI